MGLFDAYNNSDSRKVSMDIGEIINLTNMIQNCPNLESLVHLYNEYGEYNNPQISYAFGVSFLINGDHERAKKALIHGASFGMNYPTPLYNSPLVDALGQCFYLLVTQYEFLTDEEVISANYLAYVYLSRCIELSGGEAHDSYRSRALLFYDRDNSTCAQIMVMNNLGMGSLVEPLIISDFYFASQASHSPHQDALQSAKRIHQNLEDIGIGGKDADEYSIYEMAELGKKRHYTLFKTIEEKYQNGELNMSKTNSTNETDRMNLNELNFLFKSSDHIRYENGVHVSGPHGGANRAIKVEPNINGGHGVTVTLYNLDGDHPIWQNNVQMAPKQMEIIERDNYKIVLKGYGNDPMGASFADYGLTINLENGEVDECILHLIDRNVDIKYLP